MVFFSRRVYLCASTTHCLLNEGDANYEIEADYFVGRAAAGVLAMPQFAEAQGYNVRRASGVMKVAQYANNAQVNNLTLVRASAGEENDINDPDTGESLTIKIGYGLLITVEDSVREKATAKFTLWCDNNTDAAQVDGDGYESDCEATGQEANDVLDNPKATFSNEGGTGVITITIGSDDQSFVVARVRWMLPLWKSRTWLRPVSLPRPMLPQYL